jgi:hypothetical protein
MSRQIKPEQQALNNRPRRPRIDENVGLDRTIKEARDRKSTSDHRTIHGKLRMGGDRSKTTKTGGIKDWKFGIFGYMMEDNE